jgi:hypothetical protein
MLTNAIADTVFILERNDCIETIKCKVFYYDGNPMLPHTDNGMLVLRDMDLRAKEAR